MRRLFLPIFIINTIFIFGVAASGISYAGILEGEGIVKPIIELYETTGDPDCPEANPQMGISYFCGYVKTNEIDTISTSGGGETQISNQPVKGAVVAVYQAMNTPVGKSVADSNAGSLGKKANEASTDERGHFAIPIPMLGAAANRIYPMVFCNGQRMDGVMTTSIYSNFTVFKVSCPAQLTPVTAPAELSLITNRSSFLTCETPELDTDSTTAAKTIGFGKQAVKNEVDNVLYERDFDTRFRGVESSYMLEHHDGAWWSYDCVYRKSIGEKNNARGNELQCYTTTDAPNGPTPGAKAINLNDLNEANDRDYIIANTLDTLPLQEEMELYRRYEHRLALTGQYQFAAAPASFLQNMFGNPTGSVNFLKHGQDREEVLPVSCENFKKANITVADSSEDNDGTFNSYIAGGPALGLAGPTTWESIYVKLLNTNDPLLDEPVCVREGDPDKTPITLRQIEPPKVWLSFVRPGSDAYVLGEEYFHPFMLLKKGDGSLEANTDSRHDSSQNTVPRNSNFSIEDRREGDNQQAHGSKIVLPEAASGASSPVAAASITTDSTYVEGGALTDTMSDPFPVKEKVIPDGKKVYDIGPTLQALCSKASYADNTNVVSDEINNLFRTDKAQRLDTTSSTQVYYTPIAELRDKLLQGNSDADRKDSLLSVFEADEDKYSISVWDQLGILINPLTWGVHDSGPYKTFFHRRTAGEFGVPKLVGTTISYPLNEINFGEIFKGGSLSVNSSGTGGIGEYAGYPWTALEEGEKCNVWGNQYYPNVGMCNNDPNCLRTCRLENQSEGSCRRKSPTTTCTYINGGCDCQTDISESDCSPSEKFECVFKGEDTDGEEDLTLPTVPPGMAACCGTSTCEEGSFKVWKGGNASLKCELERAGPYTESIDLDNRPGHYRSQQKPLNNEAPKEDVSLIAEVGNDWLARLSSPNSAVVSYGTYAASDYQSSKKKDTNMFAKDSIGVGSGTSAPFTSLAADPSFPSEGTYGPDPNAIQPVDLAGLATPAPKEVTADDILESINKDTSCKINACPQLNTLGQDYSALIDILNAAGADWSVPAEVLLAFMYAEGTLNSDRYEWNDANTYKWSLPIGGTVSEIGYMSQCDDLTWSDIGVIPTYLRQWECAYKDKNCDTTAGFSSCSPGGASESDPQKCGVEKIAPGRGTFARRCNVLDSVYGLAKAAASHFGYSKTSCTQWSDTDKRDVINAFGVADKAWGGGGSAGYMDSMYGILSQCN